MTAPTVAVTAKLSSFGGPALAGVVITATADKDDNYQGLILRKTVTATTDTNGEAVFNLFPNALATAALPGLGTTGSTYRFTASVPNGWRMDVSAQVPNVACDLHSIVMADDAELPTPGEVAGAVRYDIAQTLTSPQQAQARANIGFDAAVRAVALTGLSLATATAVTAADSVLVAFGKAQAQITALDTAKANLSGAAFTGAVSATGFTGPLTGNVTGNVSGSAGSVAASAITGTTLAANVVTSSLTAVGTIATGVWQGTAIADTYLATISTGGKVANSATTATSANTASAIVARDASGNFTAGTITAALSGNASTATTLATARNINGVAFNGSADITVTAAAGTLTGTTLAANVVNASLSSITPAGGTLAVSGVQTITANSASPALTVTNNGAGGGLAFNDTINTQKMRVYGDGSGTNDYGIGMDSTDMVAFVGAAGGFSVKANDYDGTTWARFTSGGLSLPTGTANGVAYLNGSKVLTTGSALTFDGSGLTVGTSAANYAVLVNGLASGSSGGAAVIAQNGGAPIIAIGNKSSLLGGAYSATPMLFALAPIEINQSVAVTGSISATATAETFASTAATTSPRSLHLANTGNDVYFGIEGSSSGGFFTGSTAYATVVYSMQRVQTIIGGVKRTEVDSSGITVTGSISATSLVDISAAGAGQIKFPATQNASADANTLDDHERGDWTATLASSGGGTVTLNGTAKYTKNGNAVCVYLETFNVDISSLSAGDLSITGLPFVCSAASPAIAYFDIAGAASAGQGSVVAYASNSATAQLLRSESTAATLTALTKADLNSNVSIRFNGSYRV